MKNIILIGLIAGVIFLIGGLVYLNQSKTKQSTNTPTTNNSGYKTETNKQTDDSQKFGLDIEYPQFTNISDSGLQDQVNSQIKSIIDAEINSFKGGLKDAVSIPGSENMNSGLNIRFNVARSDEKIISTQFTVSSYYTGMAHPNNYNRVFNYSIPSKKQLVLKDIFNSGVNYLQTLSTISRQQLPAKLGKDLESPDEFVKPGTEPTEDNFKNFLINNDSLTLLFDPYQVAPSSFGTVQIDVMFSSLTNLNTSLL